MKNNLSMEQKNSSPIRTLTLKIRVPAALRRTSLKEIGLTHMCVYECIDGIGPPENNKKKAEKTKWQARTDPGASLSVLPPPTEKISNGRGEVNNDI